MYQKNSKISVKVDDLETNPTQINNNNVFSTFKTQANSIDTFIHLIHSLSIIIKKIILALFNLQLDDFTI